MCCTTRYRRTLYPLSTLGSMCVTAAVAVLLLLLTLDDEDTFTFAEAGSPIPRGAAAPCPRTATWLPSEISEERTPTSSSVPTTTWNRTRGGCSRPLDGAPCELCCNGTCCEVFGEKDPVLPAHIQLWIPLRFSLVLRSNLSEGQLLEQQQSIFGNTRASSLRQGGNVTYRTNESSGHLPIAGAAPLERQLEILNGAFASTKFRFYLDSFLIFADDEMLLSCHETWRCALTPDCRFYNKTMPHILRVARIEDSDDDSNRATASTTSPTTGTVNVLLANITGLGESSFPWTTEEDSVQQYILLNSARFISGEVEEGNNNTSSSANATLQSQTALVHELGHYLGLFHVFEPEGQCDPLYGDYVEDTPAAAAAPATGTTGVCNYSLDSCPQLPGTDPVDNYMNYGPDECLGSFTPGQVHRMKQAVMKFRPQLVATTRVEGNCSSPTLRLQQSASRLDSHVVASLRWGVHAAVVSSHCQCYGANPASSQPDDLQWCRGTPAPETADPCKKTLGSGSGSDLTGEEELEEQRSRWHKKFRIQMLLPILLVIGSLIFAKVFVYYHAKRGKQISARSRVRLPEGEIDQESYAHNPTAGSVGRAATSIPCHYGDSDDEEMMDAVALRGRRPRGESAASSSVPPVTYSFDGAVAGAAARQLADRETSLPRSREIVDDHNASECAGSPSPKNGTKSTPTPVKDKQQ